MYRYTEEKKKDSINSGKDKAESNPSLSCFYKENATTYYFEEWGL